MQKTLLNNYISFASIQYNAMYNVNSLVRLVRDEKKKIKVGGMNCLFVPCKKSWLTPAMLKSDLKRSQICFWDQSDPLLGQMCCKLQPTLKYHACR